MKLLAGLRFGRNLPTIPEQELGRERSHESMRTDYPSEHRALIYNYTMSTPRLNQSINSRYYNLLYFLQYLIRGFCPLEGYIHRKHG